jgi:Tfp pilus assembly protein PilZ
MGTLPYRVLPQGYEHDIEEAQTFKEIERLERKDSRLWLLTIFITLALILFILAKDLWSLYLSPRETLDRFISFRQSELVFPAALVLLSFCGYIVVQNRRIRRLRRNAFIHKTKIDRAMGNLQEMKALFQTASAITSGKELSEVLEIIARESLNCLKAHRSTVFGLDETRGMLKPRFSFASDPLNERVGLFEEKEMARRALRRRKGFLLREPADFAEFLKCPERDRKITSLLCIPLISQEKSLGVLSVVILDEDRKFTERDLQFLMVMGLQASLAEEKCTLDAERIRGAGYRKDYEQYLDCILDQLQTLSDVERKRIEDHIERLLSQLAGEEGTPSGEPAEEAGNGGPSRLEDIPPAQPAEALVTKVLKVDGEGDPSSHAPDLGNGGIFIRTPNPLELGEEFVLMVPMAQGEPPVGVTCRVIWTNKYGKESRHLRRGMGVKFLDLSPPVRGRVEAYIQSHKNSQFSLAEDQQHLSFGN